MTLLRPALFATILLASATCLVTPVAAQGTSLNIQITTAMEQNDYTTVRALFADNPAADWTVEIRFQYAQLLLNGQGGPIATRDGIAQLEAASTRGHAPAAVLLARFYLSGPAAGIERDPVKAVELLKSAAVLDHPEGLYYLGLLTRAGTGTAQDADAGLRLLVRAAEGGFVQAQFELSKIYSTMAPPETEQALRWLMEAAQGGITEAQFYLANALEKGQGAPNDKAKALEWYRRAAEGGMPLAQRILGTKYLTDTPENAANPSEALRWLSTAAQAGDPGAMNNLAIAYDGDNGVARDDALAMIWFKRASDADLSRATYSLAQYHESGRGTPIDIKTAALLYRKALEQGDARGAVRLGVLTGQGALEGMVPPHFSIPWARAAAETGDEGALEWLGGQAQDGMRAAQSAYGILLLTHEGRAQEATAMLTLAAEAGGIDAQMELGKAYTTGTGVALDYEAAHMWLNIAATGGQAEAAANRDLIGNLMTPDQIAAAQAGARTFFETASTRLPEAVKNNRTKP